MPRDVGPMADPTEEVAVPDRLSSLDATFLYLEQPTTVMHVGSVMILQPGPTGFDVDRVLRYIQSRIAYVPRYRQRLRSVPGRMSNPVWVDDEHFDLSYHVRRSALPRPGTEEQLAELVARLQGRRLDRRRPLWEVYLVEGLTGGRFAVVTKVHQAMVDGVHAVDVGQVLLTDEPDGHVPPPDTWNPAPEPSTAELIAGAVVDSIRRPGEVVDALLSGAGEVGRTALRTARGVGSLVLRARAPATTPGPLTGGVSEHRRFAMVATDLADYRKIRNHLTRPPRRRGASALAVNGSDELSATATINDVVLATLAGALRAWLMTRGLAQPPGAVVRTLVPMSVRAEDPRSAGAIGSRVASLLVDLPTGEGSPLIRLHHIVYQTKAHRETGQAVGAPAIAGIAGFAPPTLHSLGARVATGLSRRLFHLVVTNVPGPQHPMYLDGAQLLSSYPMVPLTVGQVLSVGVTSYDGGVYYGLNADRDAMPDVDVFGHCILDALTELLETVR